MSTYYDQHAEQWVGDHVSKLPDGDITRRTEWFDFVSDAEEFSKRGPRNPILFDARIWHTPARDVRLNWHEVLDQVCADAMRDFYRGMDPAQVRLAFRVLRRLARLENL